ncbi:MAG: CBS domain-containing protein [Pseudobdellovibrionaceae bacterium]
MKPLSVRSLPLHKPIILQKSNSLHQAALAMNRNQVGSVIVSDGRGSLRGLFTDRDLALTLALNNMSTSVELSEATHHSLIYVNETATLQDVVNLMKKFAIRRVPVVKERLNGKQTCLGIITLDDLIKENLIDPEDERKILKSQLRTSKEKLGRGKMKSIFHSQGHKDQSMHIFIKMIANETHLNRTHSRELVVQTLSLILRRMTVNAGNNLLSQLPYELQMQLLSEVSGPDRSISAKLMLENIRQKFSISTDEAILLLQSFWKGLSKTVSAGEIENTERNLPKDMALLLSPIPRSKIPSH